MFLHNRATEGVFLQMIKANRLRKLDTAAWIDSIMLGAGVGSVMEWFIHLMGQSKR